MEISYHAVQLNALLYILVDLTLVYGNSAKKSQNIIFGIKLKYKTYLFELVYQYLRTIKCIHQICPTYKNR